MGRNTLKLDTTGFEGMLNHLKEIGGDVQRATTEILQDFANAITDDTRAGVAKSELPAGGIYSTGKTEASIVTPKVVWIGGVQAEVGVGFDYAKPGAGGFLITGTPKMKPARWLHYMYRQKRYIRGLQEQMCEEIEDYIADALRGGG